MDEDNNFPLAAPVVLSDCYMDDILSRSESIEENGATKANFINQKNAFFYYCKNRDGGMNLHLRKKGRRFIDSMEALNKRSLNRCIVDHRALSRIHLATHRKRRMVHPFIASPYLSAPGEVKSYVTYRLILLFDYIASGYNKDGWI
ncbi:hypothetical protein TNCV_90511 [Trichonephila clavipes]|nr:hypothetical protein TNCV_90511 [Trichonephila clavipes]